MKSLSFYVRVPFPAIESIADERMSNVAHVNAYLMGSSRFQAAGDECAASLLHPLDYLIMSNGGLSALRHTHLPSHMAVPPNRRVHCTGILFHNSAYKCRIGSLNLSIC